MTDLENQLESFRKEFHDTWQKLQIDNKLKKLNQLEKTTEDPSLWRNPENAKKTMQDFSRLQEELSPWLLLKVQLSDFDELINLSEEDNDLKESWLVLSSITYDASMLLLDLMGINVPLKM